MPTQLTAEEFIALGELAKARKLMMQNMFSGTHLKFGKVEALKSSGKIIKAGKKVKSAAKNIKEAPAVKVPNNPLIKKQVETFITTCADVENIHDIVEAISSEAVRSLIEEITPYVGIVLGGVKVAKAGKAVAEDGYHLYKSYDYKTGFLRGDPLAAAEAVQTIIQRDLARNSVDLARHSASTGVKIAGIFADGGTATTTAIGTANACAALGLMLYELGRDIKEMKAGNKRLATPNTLDLTVFSECPLLGCYLITCADTSTVANFFIADIGLPGWMDKVETLKKKKMDPLLKIATKDIDKSRIQLEGLSSNKGTHTKKGFFAGKKSKAVKYVASLT